MSLWHAEVVEIGADAVGEDEHCEGCDSRSYLALGTGTAFPDRCTQLKSQGWRHLRDRAGMVRLCDACEVAFTSKSEDS